jgi:Xaa-Pro aminopeptidase
MPAILICGDTLRSPEMRHEVPLGIGDPFLYLEADGRRAVLTNVLEVDRIAQEAPELERLLGEQFGRDEMLAEGRPYHEIERELYVRAVRELGIRAAVVPPDFPLGVADRLRADGIELTPDDELFVERRRHKTDAELAGIRRAARAAVAGVEECARVLREAEIDRDGLLRHDGEVLTSEALRARIREACARLGAPAPDDIIVAPMRPGDAVGHDSGSGPLPAHAAICLDLWPQDEASGCWADMTRTWVRGDISDAVADLHRLVLEAHERSLEATRPGVKGVEVYGAACDVFEAAGHPTQRTKKPGETLQHGFFFGLGHGVGLEVHEAPMLGRAGHAPLIAGDVVAIEPGTVDPEHGGMRVEDLVLVTDDGYELLTDRSYDLVP